MISRCTSVSLKKFRGNRLLTAISWGGRGMVNLLARHEVVCPALEILFKIIDDCPFKALCDIWFENVATVSGSLGKLLLSRKFFGISDFMENGGTILDTDGRMTQI